MPEFFGGVFGRIRATSADAFRELVKRAVDFYAETLFNPHWGEQIRFEPMNTLSVAMVFQGLGESQAARTWDPFLSWVKSFPSQFVFEAPLRILAIHAKHFWDSEYLKEHVPDFIFTDDRPGAPASNFAWAGDEAEAGQYLYGCQVRLAPGFTNQT